MGDVDQTPAIYRDLLQCMEEVLHDLTMAVPPPKAVPIPDGFVYQFAEQTIHQAIVQKLARLVSALHAADLAMSA